MRYALVTPAKDEQDFLGRTIESVVSQSLLPVRWVIVSDGSTDRTDEIVKSYLPHHPWMRLLRLENRRSYNFGAKAHAFNAGFQLLGDVGYDLVGNVDADISFEPDYFKFLVEKFRANPRLGVAGTPLLEEEDDPVKDGLFNVEDVFGACQLFRRKCFDEVGGYTPIPLGGIDWVAVRTARMKGWQTRSFLEKRFFHHRPMGATGSNIFKARFDYGRKDYFLGNHPLWQLFRVTYQLARKPPLLGGSLILAGYLWSWLTRVERPIPRDLMKFNRDDQLRRLWAILGRVQERG